MQPLPPSPSSEDAPRQFSHRALTSKSWNHNSGLNVCVNAHGSSEQVLRSRIKTCGWPRKNMGGSEPKKCFWGEGATKRWDIYNMNEGLRLQGLALGDDECQRSR